MWNEYKDAAYLYAVKQTYTDRADKERLKRGKSSPTPREVEYRRRIEYADNRLKGKPKYKDRIAKANTAVKQLMEVSGSLGTAQADFLKWLNDDIQADIHEANLTRLDSYYDFSYSKPKVAQRAEEAQKQLADATSADKAAETRLAQLESTPAGETPAQKRNRLSELQKAKQTQRKSKSDEQSATRTIHEPDIDEYLVQKERQAKPETKQRKEEEKKMRDARLTGQFLMPKNTGDDEAERWDIYYRAQQNIEGGFPGYAMEHTISVVLDARSKIANREATGIEDAEKIDTYLSHGEGQYDIAAEADEKPGAPPKKVAAALPNTVDLSNVFGRPADPAYGRPARIFTRTESFAQPGSKGSADADVLNKLDWGFFGRGWTSQQKKGFLEGNDQNLPARDPMPDRLLAGLLFEDTIADSSLSKPVEEARTQVRKEMEEAIRADLTSQGISMDENEPVLSSVNTASGRFNWRQMINQKAFGLAIDPSTQKAFSKDQIVDLVMKSARQAVLQDENLISDVQQLMSVIRANIKAEDLAGPTVQVVHKYVEHDDKNKNQVKEQVWIAVNYIHLRQTAPDLKADKPLDQGQLLGIVGSTTNAVSPHVHMSIAVYREDPRAHKGAKPIAFLDPLDFFHDVPSPKKSASKKTGP